MNEVLVKAFEELESTWIEGNVLTVCNRRYNLKQLLWWESAPRGMTNLFFVGDKYLTIYLDGFNLSKLEDSVNGITT